jgi:hypothetical protein
MTHIQIKNPLIYRASAQSSSTDTDLLPGLECATCGFKAASQPRSIHKPYAPSDPTVVREPNFPPAGTTVGLAQLGVSACHVLHPHITSTCTYIYAPAGLSLVDLVSLEVGEPAALR